jgi:biopolymer transport protein ExbD
MAELDTSSGGGHKKGGVKKGKKASTRVDLTPMVDLGFLLITFFIFATTLATPKVVKFRVPNEDVDQEDKVKALEQGAMTALIGPDEKSVYYYQGTAPDDKVNGIKLVSLTEFRKNIINLKKSLMSQGIPDSLAILSIKPLPGAFYGTFMKVYDEVTINDLKQYVKVKPDENELKVITAYNEFNKIPVLPMDEDEEEKPATPGQVPATPAKK